MTSMRIFLGDLTHDTVGPATEIFPLNIGYIAAYCLEQHEGAVETTLFKDIRELADAIERDPPDILGLSNYPWCHNADMAMFEVLAERRPEALRIMGGPNFPHDAAGQRDFIGARPLLDAYVYLDGEVGFSNLMSLARGSRDLAEARDRLRNEAVAGCVQLAVDGTLLSAPQPIRLKELDVLPSPYLTGVLDPFFDRNLTPMISTNRGCPFRCTFCHDGADVVRKVNSFSLERVEAEIAYIAEHVPPKVRNLFISDLNFGMYKQDLKICAAIAKAQGEWNYPAYVDTTTGKNAKARVISAIEQLDGALRLTMSIQSMTDVVLDNIKRDNIRLEDFFALQPAIQSAQLPTLSEVILGLPGETYESHLETLSSLIEADIDLVVPYTLMLLNGTELATPESRQKWGFKSKFRILPRDFTRLSGGRTIVEVEEVVIETNSLSFEEYVRARKIALLISAVNTIGFKALRRYLKERGVRLMDMLLRVLDAVEAAPGDNRPGAPGALSELVADFERDTIDELWNTEAEIHAFFRDETNFQGLVDGTFGKNLLQSFNSRVLANTSEALADCVFHHARAMLGETSPDDAWVKSFDDVEHFCRGRTINLLGSDRLETVPESQLEHAIESWLEDPERRPLEAFATAPRRLRFTLTQEQYREVEDALDRFGHTPAGQAKALIRVSANALWRRPVEDELVSGGAS